MKSWSSIDPSPSITLYHKILNLSVYLKNKLTILKFHFFINLVRIYISLFLLGSKANISFGFLYVIKNIFDLLYKNAGKTKKPNVGTNELFTLVEPNVCPQCERIQYKFQLYFYSIVLNLAVKSKLKKKFWMELQRWQLYSQISRFLWFKNNCSFDM